MFIIQNAKGFPTSPKTFETLAKAVVHAEKKGLQTYEVVKIKQ